MDSTRRIPSKEWLHGHGSGLLKWAGERWAVRADDSTRNDVWRRNGNALTAGLTPGFLVQGAATLTRIPELGKK